MTFPAITAAYASLFALAYAGLSLWVIRTRLSERVLHGDGGRTAMQKWIRAHGNFAEYVPFTLLLVALLEARGGAVGLIHALLMLLAVTRVLHPAGLFAAPNSARQYVCRAGGTAGTLSVLVIAAVVLLVKLS